MNKNKKYTFKIAQEEFFNNGKIILNSRKKLKKDLTDVLSGEYYVETTTRKTKLKGSYPGITASSLNEVLREALTKIEDINTETYAENGYFLHYTKKGFDFSIYDNNYNLSNIYNYYLGSVGILNGNEKILDLHTKLKSYSKNEWKREIIRLSQKARTKNTDYHVEKKKLTMVGELQFGNWALIYRDLFRLLHANNNPGIDFYIYITATGTLKDMISSNTVNYDSANKVISEYINLIPVPTWLIGLDVN